MLLDTWPEFERWWSHARGLPPEQLAAGWLEDYLADHPELARLCTDDQGPTWAEQFSARIAPHLADRHAAMATARTNLIGACADILPRGCTELGIAEPDLCLMVGIGSGAGWATHLAGRPAIVVGLEAVAELGWQTPAAVRGLLAHELGHIWHEQVAAAGPAAQWGQLYEEGLAQSVETLLVGPDSWHEAGDGDWLTWCRANAPRLAQMLLEDSDAGRPLVRFFGSWGDIDGRIQTGYWLGHRVIADSGAPLAEVARWSAVEVDARMRTGLERIAAGAGPERG